MQPDPSSEAAAKEADHRLHALRGVVTAYERGDITQTTAAECCLKLAAQAATWALLGRGRAAA